MTNNEIETFIDNCIKNHIPIPKPKGSNVLITQIGKTKIENNFKPGFQYSISSNYKKYVTFESLFASYSELQSSGKFQRNWYNQNFPIESSSRPCNFTTIGGLFELMNIATYSNNGIYIKIN